MNLLAKFQTSSVPKGSLPAPEEVTTPTSEIARILAIPRRVQSDGVEERSVWEAALGLPGALCNCGSKFRRRCCKNLFHIQAVALSEIALYGGLLAPIGVGHGKSLLDLLAAMVMPNCKVAVLLVPANLKAKLMDVDIPFYGQHWRLPNIAGGNWIRAGRPTLYIYSYEEFSREKCAETLSRLKPDTIILDEAHKLKNRKATRTSRFLRFLKANPQARVLAWSGTLTSRTIKDYAHLAQYTLHEKSPLPTSYHLLEEWAAIIDGDQLFPREPGELRALCKPGETVWQGYSRRLRETPGVVTSSDADGCQASLIISERTFELPRAVKSYLSDLASTWERPDGGESYVDAMQVATCARQLSSGFYYRWVFPRGEPKSLINEWLELRKEWHREVRNKLKNPTTHMDSPLLLAKAAIRWEQGYIHINDAGVRVQIPPRTRNGPMPTWKSEFWSRWERVRTLVQHETEPVWVDDSLMKDVMEWLSTMPGLAWYEFGAVAAKLVKLGALHIGPGESGNNRANRLDGSERAVISIAAHGTGKDLQVHSRNLVINPPSSGTIWEQLVGRTHRKGQLSDEVTVEVYRHTEAVKEAVESARSLAAYIEGTTNVEQKLTSKATWSF